MTGKAKAGLRKRSFACLALGARSAFSGRAAGPGILLFALAFLPFFAALSSTPPPPPPILAESQLLNDI
ncbi:MAG: hypothetical protein OXI11_07160, partial [Gammaproteobacteria bacterium]|nr:hypothetical protein [Gammaproteobacteria bacterium]